MALDDVTLVILAPRLNEPFREDLRLFGWRADEREPGVFLIAGAPWATWLIETDVMAERGQPVLSFVSHALLDDPARIMKALKGTDCGPLLSYALQQIQQFVTLGEDFAMQHTGTEYLGEWTEDLKTAVLDLIPPEDMLRRLSPEDRLRGLSAEELDRMRELLARKEDE